MRGVIQAVRLELLLNARDLGGADNYLPPRFGVKHGAAPDVTPLAVAGMNDVTVAERPKAWPRRITGERRNLLSKEQLGCMVENADIDFAPEPRRVNHVDQLLQAGFRQARYWTLNSRVPEMTFRSRINCASAFRYK